jgi:hypothetical protein
VSFRRIRLNPEPFKENEYESWIHETFEKFLGPVGLIILEEGLPLGAPERFFSRLIFTGWAVSCFSHFSFLFFFF